MRDSKFWKIGYTYYNDNTNTNTTTTTTTTTTTNNNINNNNNNKRFQPSQMTHDLMPRRIQLSNPKNRGLDKGTKGGQQQQQQQESPCAMRVLKFRVIPLTRQSQALTK